jgi:hypothetical protein
METSVAEITRSYLTALHLNAVQFAMFLGAAAETETITVETVCGWLLGTLQPSKALLVLVAMRTRDWRFDWAIACLAVLDPSWVTGDELTELVVAMRLENAALRDELIRERVLTAELVEQLEAE